MKLHARPLRVEGESAQGAERIEGQEGRKDNGEQGEHSGEKHQQGVEDNAEGEEPTVRPLRDPGAPTAQERQQHELTHLPFRPWCADCVAGAAADHPHRRGAPAPDIGVVKVSVDYGFISAAGVDEQRTILVLKASGSKTVMARVVQGKGRADPFAVSWVIEQLRRLGVGRCVLQADGEPAQRTFVKDVVEEVCRTSDIGVAPAHSPAYDHQSNGAVEKAVRDVKDHVRVMLIAMARRIGQINIMHPVFEWLVAYAAELLSGARVGKDGMTSYRRLRGEVWKPQLAEFAECILARRPAARGQADAEPRWDSGIYLGTRWGSAEHFVGNADGTVRRVRAVRRRPLPERWVRDEVDRVAGVPDEPLRLHADRAAPPVPPPPDDAAVVPHPPNLPELPRLRRGFRIEAADLREHGYTALCGKCDALRIGRQVGTGHSAVCRARFAAIFEAAGDTRVERAAARRAADADAADAAPPAGPHAAEEGLHDEPMAAAAADMQPAADPAADEPMAAAAVADIADDCMFDIDVLEPKVVQQWADMVDSEAEEEDDDKELQIDDDMDQATDVAAMFNETETAVSGAACSCSCIGFETFKKDKQVRAKLPGQAGPPSWVREECKAKLPGQAGPPSWVREECKAKLPGQAGSHRRQVHHRPHKGLAQVAAEFGEDVNEVLDKEVLDSTSVRGQPKHKEDVRGIESAKATYDEYTGEPLNANLVQKAKQEELDYFEAKDVWRVVPRERARGRRVIGTRWVNCNKGDADHPEIRCRLVCQEVKSYNSDEFFAATPPGETLKMIVSMAAEDVKKEVILVDISRAYFNARIERQVFVELPEELKVGKHFVGELRKCMYGTRDAAQGWEHTYRKALEGMGFRRGKSNPCLFHHASRKVHLTVHGDDFFAEGLPESLDWFENELLRKFEGKVKGRLRQPGDEMRILNRIVRRTAEGYEWEADQRHAELIIEGMGLKMDSKPLAAPGRKLTSQEMDKGDELLDPKQASCFRGLAARANFMASDRPDIAFSVKELCRAMSAPTQRNLEALKRFARYLVGKPRVVLHFIWQADPQSLDVWTDSDWAGCARTRRSTSGGALMRGSHVLRTWSGTQATVALSSAEAELIAAVRGASEALAARSYLRDLGADCSLVLRLDSSAAIGITRRTGLGKVRHLDTRLLWIQERVASGDIVVVKTAGVTNPADLMTKFLSSDDVMSHLLRLGGRPRSGRATAAPKTGHV